MASRAIPPLISAQLNHLLSHPSLNFKVEQLASGCKDSAYNDRFTLLVPFCLDNVRWDVIYNAYHPLAAPDVVFAAEDEGFDPLPVEEGEDDVGKLRSSSLYEWDARDPTKLLKLVLELRDKYALYHRKRITGIDDERLKFEISTILSKEGIEVCLVSANERGEEVKFSVPILDMDINGLVPGCPWKQPQKMYLQAVFPVSSKYFSVPAAPRLKLFSSQGLRALFSVEDVKLPTWIDGMCMAEYVPALEENIRIQVLESVASIGARRRFIEALVPFFGRPVEADPVFCRKATFFLNSANFPFLVHFSLPTQFPKQQPSLTLQSCVHSNSQGIPILSRPLKDYPWSPRWETSQMAERVFNFLTDECLNFKKYCTETASPMIM